MFLTLPMIPWTPPPGTGWGHIGRGRQTVSALFEEALLFKKIFWLDVSSQIRRNTSKWHTILVDFYPSLPVFILTALKQMGLIVLLQKGQNQGSSSLRRRLISISLLTQSAKPKQTCSILIGGLWQPRNVKTVGTIKNYFTEPLIRHERCAEKQESTFCQCCIWMGGWIWITDGKKNFSLIRYQYIKLRFKTTPSEPHLKPMLSFIINKSKGNQKVKNWFFQFDSVLKGNLS